MIKRQKNRKFELVSKFKPAGDQEQAIDKLTAGFKKGYKEQILEGATGTGKTFTMANIIAKLNKPTLVITHNKTLVGQLYGEFKSFFPNNAVEYFVSYYDYYQPEAYVPQSDTYIEKDSAINDEIDQLRHATMAKKDGRYVVEFGDDTSKFEVVIPESKKNDALDSYVGKEVVLGVRPEDLKDEEVIVNSATTGLIDCNVEVTELMGAETYLYVQCAGVNMTARVSPRSTARPGDVIKMAININNIHLFDKETEKVILN